MIASLQCRPWTASAHLCLIDKDHDAQLTLADGASIKDLYVETNANAIPLTSSLKKTRSRFRTEELTEGSVIEIDNVVIGTVTARGSRYFHIDFVTATLPAEIDALRVAVEKLIRALTLTNFDTDSAVPERRVSLVITDSLGNEADAQVYMADRFLGDEDSNVITINSADISRGDEIDGGGGVDTLQLFFFAKPTKPIQNFIRLQSSSRGSKSFLARMKVDMILMGKILRSGS